MFKKIFLLFSTTWCYAAYAIHIADTRLYLNGYGGWHTLPIPKSVKNALLRQTNDERLRQNLSPIILNPIKNNRDKQNLTDNLNGITEGGAYWPLSQHSQLHLTYAYFLWHQQETLGNMLNNSSEYKALRTYQTDLWDLTAHYTLLNLQSNCKIYLKAGVWALHIHINEQYSPYKDDSNKNFIAKLFSVKHDKPYNTKAHPNHKTDHIGYGGLIGLGFNWLFLPGVYSSLATDLSVAAYIPFPSIDCIEPNVVMHVFPFVKGGMRWHIR